MQKVEKEKITKAECAKQIRYQLKASIPMLCVLCGMSALMALFGLGNDVADRAWYKLLEDATAMRVLAFIMAIIGEAVFFLPAVISAFVAVSLLGKFRMARRGSFRIVQDKLVRIAKDEYVREYSRGAFRGHLENAFYFLKHGRYRVTKWDRSAFDYSSEEDMFYLVLTDGKKPTILLAFNQNIYTCDEAERYEDIGRHEL